MDDPVDPPDPPAAPVYAQTVDPPPAHSVYVADGQWRHFGEGQHINAPANPPSEVAYSGRSDPPASRVADPPANRVTNVADGQWHHFGESR
ncbi:MAG TPA: hypothetical protein VG204_06780 [Terriglobia bacterium]|nr:hypothetical protein [Terriglobia bacterium]